MARFEMNIDSNIAKQLEKLNNFESIAKEALNKSAPIMVNSLRSKLSQNISAEVGNSVKAKGPFKDKNGAYYVTAYPMGINKSGHWKYNKSKTKQEKISNMDLAAYFEYGTSKMEATPSLESAIKDSEAEINNIMQDTYRKAVE